MTKKEKPPLERPDKDEAEKVVRLTQLRKAIQAGTYRVPAAELADRMLDHLDWL